MSVEHLILIILRGLPGSGKTTVAKGLLRQGSRALHPCGKLQDSFTVSASQQKVLETLDTPADYAYCSADDFFIGEDGVYRFNGHLIGQAHSQCQTKALAAMAQARRLVIVDNTHTQEWEYALYKKLGDVFQYTSLVLDLFDGGYTDKQLAARNSHGVPLEAISAMRLRYEETP